MNIIRLSLIALIPCLLLQWGSFSPGPAGLSLAEAQNKPARKKAKQNNQDGKNRKTGKNRR